LTQNTITALPNFGGWRKPVSGTRIMGFPMWVLIIAGGTGFLGLLNFSSSPVATVIMLLVSWAILIYFGRTDRHGYSGAKRFFDKVRWQVANMNSANIYRSGALAKSKINTNLLPGILASSSLYEYRTMTGDKFGVLHYPHENTVTAIIEVNPNGIELVDTPEFIGWVDNWGRWLKNAFDEPGLLQVSATVDTYPDSGVLFRNSVKTKVVADAPPLAVQIMSELGEAHADQSKVVRSFVSLTFATAPGQKKQASGVPTSLERIAKELASRLPALTQQLLQAGLGVARLMTESEICDYVRGAYDPDAIETIDEWNVSRSNGKGPETAEPFLRWSDVGPEVAKNDWDNYFHSDYVSKTWVMSSPPPASIKPDLLRSVLSPEQGDVRKRMTIIYMPIDPGVARASLDKQAKFARGDMNKNNPTARDSRELSLAEQMTEEEASGEAVADFQVLITTTVPGSYSLVELNSKMRHLASQTRIQMRPAFGNQDFAFTAALPLGAILSRSATAKRLPDRTVNQ
jgi:hypothetical protein